MTKWLQWSVLTMITGSPLGSLVILLVFWYGVDRVTFRFLPNPVRALGRWRRMMTVRNTLAVNPHDRRARLELAEFHLEGGRFKDAVEVLKPNLDAGDDDLVTLYTMGVACLGAGYAEQGEKLLSAVADEDADFRQGAVDLELGRWRLKRGDAKGAREALERFVEIRKGTVEGRVLLARALDLGKDDAAAALMREAAWKEYVAAPRFHRNVERFWAWRAKPSRPLLYAAVGLALLLLFARFGALAMARMVEDSRRPNAAYTQDDDE